MVIIFTVRNFRKIGILGGMGLEATAELYLRIIRIFQRKYGARYDADFPEIFILNLPIPDVVEDCQEEEKVGKMLIEGVIKIEAAGADFVAIPCNTVSYFLPELQRAVTIPILNIIQETVNEVRKQSLRKIGILGTKTTVNKNLYNSLQKIGIPIFLNQKDQQNITKIIVNILSGTKKREDRKLLQQFIQKLKKMGAEKVILGCTELPLLVKGNQEALDTLEILARAVVREATKNNKPSGL